MDRSRGACRLSSIPTQASELLKDLPAALSSCLGENLVGIYLYGSLFHSEPGRCPLLRDRPLGD